MGIPWEILDETSQFINDYFHIIMKGVNKMGIIYSFTNLVNNKKYIGQSINDDNSRYKNHISATKYETNSEYNSPLHRSIRKYGLENFKYEILVKDVNDIELLNNLEIYYIQKFNSLVPNGYNIEEGGKNCRKPKTQEQKIKLTWSQAKLSEEEIIELRKAYANNESPSKIYEEKYKDRLHYNSFLNIWSGKRYGNILPELLQNGRHTKMTQEKANEIRKIYQEEKISYQKIADKFGISKSTVADIISNRTWKNV